MEQHFDDNSDFDDDPTEADLEVAAARIAEMQKQLLEVSAGQVAANHMASLCELALLHLAQAPPNLSESRIAIDAAAGLHGAISGRMGDSENEMKTALSQIQMFWVQQSQAASTAAKEAAADDDS